MTTSVAIAIDATAKANPQAVACELDGEVVILNLVSGVYFGLNSVGGEIWTYIQTERSIGEIIQHLLTQYQVERARCESEVVALLRKMNAQDLVTIRNL